MAFQSASMVPETGSFRDPDSRVFLRGDEVIRLLSRKGAEDYAKVSETAFFRRALEDGSLVATESLASPEADELIASDGWVSALRHERIPFISYPYEWPFSMLRDAALLQLDLTAAALDEGLISKDATPYNVQWRGARPTFIDIGSFEVLEPGEPWYGYRQFCQLFLYPLFLGAYKDLPHQPWLRGSLEGITPHQCRQLMGGLDYFRRGVLTHVFLQDKLQGWHGRGSERVQGDMKRAGFQAELIQANVRRLRKLVARLRPRARSSEWSSYGAEHYTDEDRAEKRAVVERAARARRGGTVWDLGCNDGRFSRVAAEHAGYVLAIDADETVVDRLYHQLRDEGVGNILPLCMSVADPSPGLGWRGMERQPLEGRGSPDLVLCLAVVHHLAITHNVPLPALLDWLLTLDCEVVVEFPAREDPMVGKLLANKREGVHDDYRADVFERAIKERFEVIERQDLPSGTRTLYRLLPRGRREAAGAAEATG